MTKLVAFIGGVVVLAIAVVPMCKATDAVVIPSDLNMRLAILEGTNNPTAYTYLTNLSAKLITATNQLAALQATTSTWNQASTDATSMTNWYTHGASTVFTNDLAHTNVVRFDHGTLTNVVKTP